MITEHLEPQDVFFFFEEISHIPRPSGKEEAIADYLVTFAERRNLECYRDAANNIVILQPASPGREKESALLLQGHIDMVCEKDADCAKDMDAEGLDLELSGDWLSAKGTTLGGDDGIAVAIILALLSDPTLSHPRLECIFTTEEETGMNGARAFTPEHITGRQLLNIDSEEEGVLTVGCAGGETYGIRLPLQRQTASGTRMRLLIGGLAGGHSGIEIGKGQANADVLLFRILRHLFCGDSCCENNAGSTASGLFLLSLFGGSKNNAIPREAEALLLLSDAEHVQAAVEQLEKTLRSEYAATDPDLYVRLLPEATASTVADIASASVLTPACVRTILSLFSGLPNGVQRMDPQLEGLVETSLNLGILRTDDDALYAEYLLRSSRSSCLDDLDDRMTCLVNGLGGSVQRADRYPAWEYAPQSAFRERLIRLFRVQYGKDPAVETVHAGLECGLLAEKIPGLDAVSIGPEMVGIHTPEERLSVSSTQRVYRYVRAILEEAPSS